MAGSCSRLAPVLLAVSLLGGCVSGRLFEAGRISETLVTYDRAHRHGDELVVGYTVRVADADDVPMGEAERAVRIPVAALYADPAPAVDAFPLEYVRWEDACDGTETPARLEWLPGDGAPAGFRLCEPDAERCGGLFYTDALYRDRTAWWVWPVLPIAGVADVLLMPVHLVMTTPFFLSGD
jgi:hypothetical protein